MTTRVVHIHKDPYDVYIGRPGHGEEGFWGNPFSIGPDGTRSQVIAKFRAWLLHSPQAAEQRRRLPELKGKVLGCFCAPQACHGDVLAELADAGIEHSNDQMGLF